jgi:hypothetical protein
VWHERLGTQSQTVIVGDGDTPPLRFVYES